MMYTNKMKLIKKIYILKNKTEQKNFKIRKKYINIIILKTLYKNIS